MVPDWTVETKCCLGLLLLAITGVQLENYSCQVDAVTIHQEDSCEPSDELPSKCSPGAFQSDTWVSFESSNGSPLELPYFSGKDYFCFQKGACGSRSPIYIQLNEGETLPVRPGESVNLTLCTTTYVDGDAICCDRNDVGQVEVKNCGVMNGESFKNNYVYKILSLPRVKCGSVCAIRQSCSSDNLPLQYTVEHRLAIPPTYEELPAEIKENILEAVLTPKAKFQLQERLIWLQFKAELQQRLGKSVFRRSARSTRAIAVRLLAGSPERIQGNSLKYTFYAWNYADSQPLKFALVCEAVTAMPTVSLKFDIISSSKAVDYLEDNLITSPWRLQPTPENRAYITAMLVIVGTMAVAVALLILCLCKHSGIHTIPGKGDLAKRNENGSRSVQTTFAATDLRNGHTNYVPQEE